MPFFLKTSCRAASRVFCLNSEERGWLVSSGWAPPDRIAVMPHGVPGDFFSGSRSFQAMRTMLFVGQWLPAKGVRYLVDAVEGRVEVPLRALLPGVVVERQSTAPRLVVA